MAFTCKKFPPDTLAFTINLLIDGSPLAQEKGCHGRGHFAFAGENDIRAGLLQLLRLPQIGGAAQDAYSPDLSPGLLSRWYRPVLWTLQ
jgi:hypothetical protein